MEQHRPMEFEGPRRHPRRSYNSNVRRVAFAVAGSPRGTRGRQLNSTPPLNDVMKYTVQSWLAIIALKYQQGSATTLLTEDPVPMWSFLTSNCAYWLIAGMMKLMPHSNRKCFRWLIRAAVAAGLLSVLSLLSILLQCKFWFVHIAIWLLLLLVALAWPLFSWRYNHVRTRITGVGNKIRALAIWPGGRKTIEATHLPV